jgi:GTP-sensing pleiotropic transcriptional regulator CodY
MNLENIQNIKQLYSLVQSDSENENQYKIICNKIIKVIESNQFSFLKFRHLLYELLIYHLNMYECIWYIQSYFIENGKIPEKEVNQLLIKTFTFFQYFNNNYRPIYHLEHYFLSMIKMIKGL